MSDGHLSAETLSSLAEGALTTPDASRAERHLAGCPDCRETWEALSRVRVLLQDLPPAPMPEHVASALDARLAEAGRAWRAEQGLTAPDEPADGHERPTTVRPLASPRRRLTGARLAWVGAVAACLALVVGGVAVFNGLDGGSGSSSVQAGAERSAAGDGTSAGQVTVTRSGSTYKAGSLPGAVRGLLHPRVLMSGGSTEATDPSAPGTTSSRPGAGGVAPNAQAERPTVTTGLGDPATLAGCVSHLRPGGVRPLAVDVGSFGGRPAAVVVLPTAQTPRELDVWVVDPACSASGARVRYHARVPRP